MGLLESELIRMEKGTFDLSESCVTWNYEEKALKYARLHGSLNFAEHGSFADVVETINAYGIIPEEAYPGLHYGTDRHEHDELDKVLKEYMDGIIGVRALTPVWHKGFWVCWIPI